MLKIGVFGAGHIGRVHIKLLKSSKKFELIGFYDPDKNTIEKLDEDNTCRYFDSPTKLIKKVDVIDIISPTSSHLEMAMMAIINYPINDFCSKVQLSFNNIIMPVCEYCNKLIWTFLRSEKILSHY